MALPQQCPVRNREYVMPQRMRDAVDKAPPHFYFVFSAVFHYLGPASAVLLFARVDVLGVAWLRIASAAFSWVELMV